MWQGVLVAGLVWIVLAMLRNNSARVRYFVCCAALGSMTVLPLVTAWTVYRDPAAAVTTPTVDWAAFESTSGLPAGTSLPAWIAALEGAALPVWFAGVLVFAVRLIWISGHVARLRRVGQARAGPVMEHWHVWRDGCALVAPYVCWFRAWRRARAWWAGCGR
jgi:hypothetical protein